MTYKIQRFSQTVTIPISNDQELGPVLPKDLNGILKGIIVDAPAMSGTSLTLTIYDSSGAVIYTKASISVNAQTGLFIDSNNEPLALPMALVTGDQPLKIEVAGTGDATAELTGINPNATDGDLITIGVDDGGGSIVYRAKGTTAQAFDVKIPTTVQANELIISTANGLPSADDTVTIAGQVYTFKADPTAEAFAVDIGTDGQDGLNNLLAAINLTGTPDDEYGAGTTQHATVEGVAVAFNDPDYELTVRARVGGEDGNLLGLTESADNTTVGGALLSGGIGMEAFLANLDAAIEADGTGDGTDYHAGTTAHPDVTASVTDALLTITAKGAVDDATVIETLEDSSELSWGAGFMVGGGEASARNIDVDLLLNRR